ncbi:hypothetical protein D9M70_603330 [compost metagenome]
MPERVVEALEVVDINHQQCQRRSLTLCSPGFHGKALIEAAPIGQTGKGILHRNQLKLPIR